MNSKIQNTLFYYISFSIIEIFILRLLTTFNIINYVGISYFINICLIINIILIISFIARKKMKLQWLDFLLIIYILLCIISTIFAYDRNMAVFGAINRYEGLLSITYYITIIIIASFIDKEKINSIINIIIGIGIFETGMGFIQLYKGNQYISGFISNANFYATYINICLWCSIYFIFHNKSKLYYLLFILFIVALILSNTLSCILSSLIGIGLLLLINIKEKKLSKSFLVIGIFISIVALLSYLNVNKIGTKIMSFGKDTVQITKGNINEKMGTGRIYIWKKTIPFIPKYLIHGIGIDNYYYLDDGSPIYYPIFYKNTKVVREKFIYDKAHNDYLQILITEGIFALIVYLSIIGILLFQSYKYDKYYFLIIFTYLIQIFFSISVIEVAPIFYILLGLSYKRK